MPPADAVLWSPGRVSVGADMMCVRCVNEMNEKMQERDETEGALPLLCVSCVSFSFQNSPICKNENFLPAE